LYTLSTLSLFPSIPSHRFHLCPPFNALQMSHLRFTTNNLKQVINLIQNYLNYFQEATNYIPTHIKQKQNVFY
jgi:hypothetical protein